jgi:glycerophosphoryl diester phosphodiesterase
VKLRRLRRLALVGLGLLLATLLGLHLLARPRPAHPWWEPQPGEHHPLLIAHQGGEGEWPSNTMLGFRKSAELGADVLDTDIHLTGDGVLVLIHDTTVDRTTDGHGALGNLTWKQVEQLDAGYRFGAPGFPYRGRGLKIPRLEELLQAFPRHRLNLELKETAPLAVSELKRLLDLHRAHARVVVGSFSPALMAEVRRQLPGVATSATPGEVKLFWALSRLHLESLYTPGCEAMQVPPRHGKLQVVDPRFVEAAHSRGMKVMPWTLDTEAEFDHALSCGVDGINTNYPSRLLQRLSRIQSR